MANTVDADETAHFEFANSAIVDGPLRVNKHTVDMKCFSSFSNSGLC